MTPDESKRSAAIAALAELASLPDGSILGLGTGSTARLFIEEVGGLVRGGRRFRAVPTSEASRVQAEALGIEVLAETGPWDIAVTIDGADEVDPRLDLIKGGGGAHLREKIVNYASRRNVIIVDESKLSPSLGVHWPVPVEVVPFAHRVTAERLGAHGKPVQRLREGAPFRTDSGNVIYDLACGPIADARALDRSLREIPGVVETGLFIGRADVVIVAGANGVERRTPPVPGRP
jgi:ribose 5-phosphate isomerase A